MGKACKTVLVISNTGTDKLVSIICDTGQTGTGQIVIRNNRKTVLVISNTGTDKLVSIMLDTGQTGTGMIVKQYQ